MDSDIGSTQHTRAATARSAVRSKVQCDWSQSDASNFHEAENYRLAVAKDQKGDVV
jgi:hypothetical protein